MRIHSGYKTITPVQLANMTWALNQRSIDLRGARIYFACFALVAVREAAARLRRGQAEQQKGISRFRLMELERMTGLGTANVRRALRQLEQARLIVFSESDIAITKQTLPGSDEIQDVLACRRSPRRPIPVPRSMLRFLAKNRSEALLKTVMAYCVRGLSITRRIGDVCSKGTVKASWIAGSFSVSQRAVKYAQAELRALDWISKDTLSIQRKLNRDGAYFVINLEWRSNTATETPKQRKKGAPAYVVTRDKPCSNVARPQRENAPDFAPPIEDKETSIELKYHQTQATEPRVAGVCKQGNKSNSLPPPSMKRIRPEDLYSFSRLESLYFEALELKWINRSEATVLNFIAAAVKAREEGDEPVRLFVSIVRRGLWPHINQGQEERARVALNHYRQENPERFRPPSRSVSNVPLTRSLSSDSATWRCVVGATRARETGTPCLSPRLRSPHVGSAEFLGGPA